VGMAGVGFDRVVGVGAPAGVGVEATGRHATSRTEVARAAPMRGAVRRRRPLPFERSGGGFRGWTWRPATRHPRPPRGPRGRDRAPSGADREPPV
jgi:hypothetical protein